MDNPTHLTGAKCIYQACELLWYLKVSLTIYWRSSSQTVFRSKYKLAYIGWLERNIDWGSTSWKFLPTKQRLHLLGNKKQRKSVVSFKADKISNWFCSSEPNIPFHSLSITRLGMLISCNRKLIPPVGQEKLMFCRWRAKNLNTSDLASE